MTADDPDDDLRALLDDAQRRADLDQQWAEVDRRLDGMLAEDRPRVRPRQDQRTVRRWALLAAGVVVVALAAGWLVGVSSAGDHLARTPRASSFLVSVLVVGGIVVALGAWTTGTVQKVRRQGIWVPVDEPLRGLPRAERVVVGRVIRGHGAVDPARLRTLRRLATLRLDQSAWTIWFGIGWLGLATSQVASHQGSGWTWVPFVLGGVWAVGLAIATIQRRQWRAFLAVHPLPEPTHRG
ncbi:hypothetical protein [Curtobacterium sp. MCBA15_001]|uniref:hypothetical protein n=1 Tax=Curtobacterium sp. MCBA15_001 TaxID=1898731 RepID=UPI0008DE79CC|nr:hypothetical protein [Curtobacterium sp. MCBA15_001]OIH97697.1 hypothetical protein BIU90_14105 [Curtobacterium sp. MCBA15_001]